MAEDNDYKGLSKTSPWEDEICQAAREATLGKLDPDEDVLAAVATDHCLIALTNRNLRTIDKSRSKILLTWPLAEIKNLRVEGRSGGTWLSFETTQGEHRRESLVGEWALFGEAVDEFLTSGRVASESNQRLDIPSECPKCLSDTTDAASICRSCNFLLSATDANLFAASLWRRSFGFVADVLIISVTFLLGWLVWFYFTAQNGQTPGKLLFSIKVINVDGTPITPGNMWVREVLFNVILFPILAFIIIIGWATVYQFARPFWDENKQTWVDKVNRWNVVRMPELNEEINQARYVTGQAKIDPKSYGPHSYIGSTDTGLCAVCGKSQHER